MIFDPRLAAVNMQIDSVYTIRYTLNMNLDGFDWDAGNAAKCTSHGVGIAEIEALFARPVFVIPDPTHSIIEERKIALGLTAVGRAVFLVFTERRNAGALFIRPISARFMHAKERRKYAEILASLEK